MTFDIIALMNVRERADVNRGDLRCRELEFQAEENEN